MTEADKVAFELSEDRGTVGKHKLHAKPCSVCRRQIKYNEPDVRVYRRPKRVKTNRRKGVMHNYHVTGIHQRQSDKDRKETADMSGAQIKPKLISYFRQHPGIDVYVDDIVHALDETRERVLGGMTNILNPNQHNSAAVREFAKYIEKRGTGVWRYRPPDQKQQDNERPNKRLFTELGGPTKDGYFILECEDGKLFRAEEM